MIKSCICCLLAILLFSCKSPKHADYLNELTSSDEFDSLYSSPPKSNYGQVQSIKVLYNFKENKIYYINSKKFPDHFSFAKKKLGITTDSRQFFYDQYGKSSNRSMYLLTINYFKKLDKYIFEFGAYDLVNCNDIFAAYKKLLETSYFKEKLVFHVNNLQWENCKNIPAIKSDELYFGQTYQALNIEECYGYLKKIDVKNLDTTSINKHDIILINTIPNDVPVVSGIICSEFQSALSHINILSYNRHTPNMTLKDAWSDTLLANLENSLVYLKVENNQFKIRKAGLKEANLFWNRNQQKNIIHLEKDTLTSELITIKNLEKANVKTAGGKAANFFELAKLKTIPLPENAFAIPFYYYEQHIRKNKIDTLINNALVDPKFISDQGYRKKKLKEIRSLITKAALSAQLINLVLKEINDYSSFSNYKFRSSTNAEDIDGFNGAGLYDSYSAIKNHKEKNIDAAIKKVWASLWNFRAFEEREYFKIDQRSVAMGILVHRSFPNEDANGVVITKNLFNVNHGYTINVQYKDISTVKPEANITNDQIIAYTINLIDNRYTFEYLNRSNVKGFGPGPVLTNKELLELADVCTTIKQHYFKNILKNTFCPYNNFAVDIEFKIDSEVEKRKLYIKQVRLFDTCK